VLRQCDACGAAAQGDDNHGHGTRIAGIVAAARTARNTGVAPGASSGGKVLDVNGSNSYAAVASGISYAASNGARVINLESRQLGVGFADPPLQQAASTAVIVAAAGNGTAYAPGYPAAYAASGRRGQHDHCGLGRLEQRDLVVLADTG
jgi:hypothetical protein